MAVVAGSQACPCGLGEPYAECCGRLHQGLATGAAKAPTAERLMRSRYSAFAVQDAEYLRATWHPSTRPPVIDLDPSQDWVRLVILGRTGGGFLDDEGTVEFVAQYRRGRERGRQHENSRFVRENGHWLYVAPV